MTKEANEILLHNKMCEDEMREKFYSIFLDEIDLNLEVINEQIEDMYHKAEMFNYDFGEDVKKIIMEQIS